MLKGEIDKMPKRDWRKCATCEWWDGFCFNSKKSISDALSMIFLHLDLPEELPHFQQMTYDENRWCSEWKSAEPEPDTIKEVIETLRGDGVQRFGEGDPTTIANRLQAILDRTETTNE
jgi:hypothetical protein